MEDHRMVHDANQIAAYFEAYPEQRARESVLDHLWKFWPPSMRAQLVAFNTQDGEGLHPLVVWAAEQITHADSRID